MANFKEPKDPRPQWIIDSHIKDVDLHGYPSMALALEQVDKSLAKAKSKTNNTFKFIPGRGTHSEVNEFGRKYKETKNWKREVKPLLLEEVRKHLQAVAKDFNVFEMLGRENATEIYVRFKEGSRDVERRKSSSASSSAATSYLPDDLLPPTQESDNED